MAEEKTVLTHPAAQPAEPVHPSGLKTRRGDVIQLDDGSVHVVPDVPSEYPVIYVNGIKTSPEADAAFRAWLEKQELPWADVSFTHPAMNTSVLGPQAKALLDAYGEVTLTAEALETLLVAVQTSGTLTRSDLQDACRKGMRGKRFVSTLGTENAVTHLGYHSISSYLDPYKRDPEPLSAAELKLAKDVYIPLMQEAATTADVSGWRSDARSQYEGPQSGPSGDFEPTDPANKEFLRRAAHSPGFSQKVTALKLSLFDHAADVFMGDPKRDLDRIQAAFAMASMEFPETLIPDDVYDSMQPRLKTKHNNWADPNQGLDVVMRTTDPRRVVDAAFEFAGAGFYKATDISESALSRDVPEHLTRRWWLGFARKLDSLVGALPPRPAGDSEGWREWQKNVEAAHKFRDAVKSQLIDLNYPMTWTGGDGWLPPPGIPATYSKASAVRMLVRSKKFDVSFPGGQVKTVEKENRPRPVGDRK
jgi:hypothetical protein